MFIEAVGRDLLVCAQSDCAGILGAHPHYWNVISIRHGSQPRPGLLGARQIHRVEFADADHPADPDAPQIQHLEAILNFCDELPGEPLLIHCWAGISRSTAVALTLILRSLAQQKSEDPRFVTLAIDLLLALRPHALPNPSVLSLGLQAALPPGFGRFLADEALKDPRIAPARLAPLASSRALDPAPPQSLGP